MIASSSNSIKSNVIGGVLTAGCLAIVAYIWAFAPGVWKWFTDLLASIWTHLTTPASVPTWWLYALYAISAITVLTLALRIRSAIKATGPIVTEYREDRFFGAIWRWKYFQGGPTGIWAFCPACDTVLVYSYQRDFGDLKTALHCETCNRTILTESGDKDDLQGKVHRQIDRKIRNGEWKNNIEPNE